MVLRRIPVPTLRPFVSMLWASDDTAPAESRVATRELVLPTGAMHLVFRLSPLPLRLFEHAGSQASRAVGHAVVGGARTDSYVRDISAPSRAVGAMLRPGAAKLLFGGSAVELAGRHTRLDDLWGRDAVQAHERLLEAPTLERALQIFETVLAVRLPRVRGVHPAVAEALDKLAFTPSVADVVAGSGYSHRRFIALFEDAVGLTPKRYTRVIRFQQVLADVHRAPHAPLVELALAAGYADQSHFNRDFREMAGMSPRQYRAANPREPHHVEL